MSFTDYLKKPEFYFQPLTAIKRLTKSKATVVRKQLWGGLIEVNLNETIGHAVGTSGIYDLAVSEVLWRLIEPGNFVIDIGANIGYTSNICSHKTGITGKVWSIEPNPLLTAQLKKNLAYLKYQNTRLFSLALSNSNGSGYLVLPNNFNANQGIAYIGSQKDSNSHKVQLKKLDDLLPAETIVDLIKIDVEGHELEVFEGAANAFQKKMISNIIFEDQEQYPSGVSNFLLERGFKIFRIEKGWLNVVLKNPSTAIRVSAWEPVNYLATLNVQFVKEKMNGFFYRCLR